MGWSAGVKNCCRKQISWVKFIPFNSFNSNVLYIEVMHLDMIRIGGPKVSDGMGHFDQGVRFGFGRGAIWNRAANSRGETYDRGAESHCRSADT